MAGELGFDTGPFVTVATFCDDVIEGKDGVLSLIRVVDQLRIDATGPEAPNELPAGVVQTKLVVILKRGESLGAQVVRIDLEEPGTKRHQGPEIAVNFPGGPGSGANIVVPMQFAVESAGLYWAHLMVNGRLMAKVPLEIVYGFTRGPGQIGQ